MPIYTGKLTWVRDKLCDNSCKYYNYCDKSYDVYDPVIENWPPFACHGRLRPELKSDTEIWKLAKQENLPQLETHDETQQETTAEYKPNIAFILIVILGIIMCAAIKILEMVLL